MNNEHPLGILPGGLTSITEIKVLICYLLKSIDGYMTKAQIAEAFFDDGLVNFFDASASVDALLENGHIMKNTTLNNGEEEYTITALGIEAAAQLERTVPFTVREKAVKAALKLIYKNKNENENTVDIKKVEDGYIVTCSIKDIGSDLLTLGIFVGDKMQATCIKENFQLEPQKVYMNILKMLTGNFNLFE